MSKLSFEELTSIALTFQEYPSKFPAPIIFIKEIQCGITFERESSEPTMMRDYLSKHDVDEDELAAKLYKLLEEQPAEFEKLYLAVEKFWSVEVADLQERLKKVGLISA